MRLIMRLTWKRAETFSSVDEARLINWNEVIFTFHYTRERCGAKRDIKIEEEKSRCNMWYNKKIMRDRNKVN